MLKFDIRVHYQYLSCTVAAGVVWKWNLDCLNRNETEVYPVDDPHIRRHSIQSVDCEVKLIDYFLLVAYYEDRRHDDSRSNNCREGSIRVAVVVVDHPESEFLSGDYDEDEDVDKDWWWVVIQQQRQWWSPRRNHQNLVAGTVAAQHSMERNVINSSKVVGVAPHIMEPIHHLLNPRRTVKTHVEELDDETGG